MYRGQLYVLRVWKEPGLDEPEGWRASLLDTLTQEKRYFASPQTLLRYLLEMNPNLEGLEAINGPDPEASELK